MHQQPAYHVILQRRSRRRRAKVHSSWRLGLLVLLAPLAALVLVGSCSMVVAFQYANDLSARYPSAADAIAARGGGAQVYDRNGTLLFQFLDEAYGMQRNVALDDVSPWLQAATISAEDASFYDNPGINVRGLARATVENLRPGDEFLQGSGGSSITQQLVKQIYFTSEEREARSIDRKIKEVVLALRMTDEYSKQQILEWYLNEVPYGNQAIGAQSAALAYFGIPARDLTLAQSAFLAGLPQSPSRYDPFVNFEEAKRRQGEVLTLMERHGAIDSQMHGWALLEDIRLNPQPRPFLAPHFVQYVADYLRGTMGEEALLHGGLSVLTTLDLPLNDAANATLEKYLLQYEKSSNGHNGAVVILQPETGQILAMVGSRDYFRGDVDGEVNNATALNSPGSTLKPFTYATAFMQGWGPEWPIVDSGIRYKDGDDKIFEPRNPDGRNRGVMPLKQALGNSFNIPAFKTILWAGVDNVRATAGKMGITTLNAGLGPALTLGGADVKLLDLTHAYATFGNEGRVAGTRSPFPVAEGITSIQPNPVLLVKNRKGDIVLDNSVPQFEVAIEPEYAWMINDILSKDENRQITYGRGSNLNISGRKVAVKTGTSEPYDDKKRLIGDTWTVGYTRDIAVGVWVGNSDNTPMVNIFSTTIAGSTWNEVMTLAVKDTPVREWEKPPGIVEATVCVPSGVIAKKDTVCPKVTGMFALRALGVQTDKWWGGIELAAPRDKDDLTTVPAGLDEWKRYLASEYLRSYRSGLPAPPRPAPTPIATPRAVETPVPDAGGGGAGGGNDGDGGRGNNGNGNGRGRDSDGD